MSLTPKDINNYFYNIGVMVLPYSTGIFFMAMIYFLIVEKFMTAVVMMLVALIFLAGYNRIKHKRSLNQFMASYHVIEDDGKKTARKKK